MTKGISLKHIVNTDYGKTMSSLEYFLRVTENKTGKIERKVYKLCASILKIHASRS